MLRAVRSTFSPLFKAQIKNVACLQQNVKTHININPIRLCSTKFNPKSWVDSLDEAQQKRIRHIQNEVRPAGIWTHLRFMFFVWINWIIFIRIVRIKFQMTLMQLQNKPAPDLEQLQKHDYEHMLTLSNNQRQKYYTYLFKTQKSTQAVTVIRHLTIYSWRLAIGQTFWTQNWDFIFPFQLKREISKQVSAEKLVTRKESDPNETGHIQYGLGKGALIPRVYHRTINNWKNIR